MNQFHIKRYLPKSLLGRSILILIIPIITIQLLVGFLFYDRIFRDITIQKTNELSRQLKYVLESSNPLDAESLEFTIQKLNNGYENHDQWNYLDFTGRQVTQQLHKNFDTILFINLKTTNNTVEFGLKAEDGNIMVIFSRYRVSVRNPHQLLVIMTIVSVLLTIIAFLFLRNQVKPLRRLAQSAEAFGKGKNIPFHTRGSSEVRLVAHAFQAMKIRIEQHINQRTLILSGVSHDLRTPLTRMKLSLEMLENNDEITHLRQDVLQMENIINEFLAFTRGDGEETHQIIDLKKFSQSLQIDNSRAGLDVETKLLSELKNDFNLNCYKTALTRALNNLLSNAARYGDKVRLTIEIKKKVVNFLVEDDGVGISEKKRNVALLPFERLDAARNQNNAGGSGLGLAIASDIARRHGGSLTLEQSSDLGGLCAIITIPK